MNFASQGKITRFEVIDETGRAYVATDVHVVLQQQDDGRTLKAFIAPRYSRTNRVGARSPSGSGTSTLTPELPRTAGSGRAAGQPPPG